MERQTERGPEGSEQVTSQDHPGKWMQLHQITSAIPRASTPRLRAGRPPPRALDLAAILCPDIPDSPQLEPPHHMGGGEVLPGAGHRPQPWKEMGTAGEEGKWRTKSTFRPSLGCGLLIPSRQGVGGGQRNRFGVGGGRDSVWAPEEAAMTSKGQF